MQHSVISLTSVYELPNRHALLYSLLKERDETIKISHKEMPCWGDHVRFIESIPYLAWYFVMAKRPVGACYLSRQNEIGISIFKDHQGKGYGPQAIKALMLRHGKRRYLANINPRNERSAAIFMNLGFRLAQHTYAHEPIPGR